MIHSKEEWKILILNFLKKEKRRPSLKASSKMERALAGNLLTRTSPKSKFFDLEFRKNTLALIPIQIREYRSSEFRKKQIMEFFKTHLRAPKVTLPGEHNIYHHYKNYCYESSLLFDPLFVLKLTPYRTNEGNPEEEKILLMEFCKEKGRAPRLKEDGRKLDRLWRRHCVAKPSRDEEFRERCLTTINLLKEVKWEKRRRKLMTWVFYNKRFPKFESAKESEERAALYTVQRLRNKTKKAYDPVLMRKLKRITKRNRATSESRTQKSV